MTGSFMGFFIVANVILIGVIISNIINKLSFKIGIINNRYILLIIKAIIAGIIIIAYLYCMNILALHWALPGLLPIKKLFSLNMLIWLLICPIFTVLLFSIMNITRN
ncbi:hypothetical protein [Lutispora sp.]|uniref:hypothetical protein n=1 Tax=Lutispora sp. TaxID=2828727 RepID=UPI002B21654B|nr:hypothetical protein [Lutispora sp.]MEA4960548.1 hypothetical protein [Lutispora sp.]